MIAATMKSGTGIVFGIVTSNTVTSSSSFLSSPVGSSSLSLFVFGLKGRPASELVARASLFVAA